MSSGFKSYKNLFKIKYKVYKIGAWALPRAVPVDLFLIFFVMLIPSYHVSKPLAGLFATSPYLLMLLVSGIVTWALGRADPQGQPLILFLWHIISFIFKKKCRDFTGMAVVGNKKHRLDWQCVNLEPANRGKKQKEC